MKEELNQLKSFESYQVQELPTFKCSDSLLRQFIMIHDYVTLILKVRTQSICIKIRFSIRFCIINPKLFRNESKWFTKKMQYMKLNASKLDFQDV